MTNFELEPSPQPLLFDADQLPVLPGVVTAAVKWEHNGRYTLADEELCNEIAQRVLMKFSARSIARTLHVSRLTVRAVMQVLEERGKLGPLKQRMSQKMGYAMELCLDRGIEALEEDRVPVASIPIFYGVLFDKKSLSDGDPTARVDHRHEETVTLEGFRAWLEGLKRQRVIEVESSAEMEICEVSGGGKADDTTDATISEGATGQNARVSVGAEKEAGGGVASNGLG